MTTADGRLHEGLLDGLATSPGRIDFYQSGGFFALGTSGDASAPVVDTFSPAAAASILRSDALTFHVTDVSTIASMVVTMTQGSAPAEVIYNGWAFVAPYLASSTINSITSGYAFSVTRDNGWQNASITLRVVAVDNLGNVSTTTAAFTVTNPPTGPVVDTFSPSAASSILLTDSVSFHVTDETALASAVVLVTQGSDPVEVAHNGSAFVGPYLASSTRSVITGGYAFVLVRDAGWQRSALIVSATAVDGQGNVTSTSAAYTVTNPPAAPVIGSYSPSAAASITRTTALTYHVTDETSLGPVLVWATQGSDPVETVHDGSSFVAPYAAGSTRSGISGGYAYSIVRAGGWQRSALTLSTKAVDGQGNVMTSTASFTVTNPPGAPVVGTFSPADNSSISKTTAATFRVTDETLLLRAVVYATHSTGLIELVHDGSAFKAPYSTSSTRSSISGGYAFSISRTGNWPAAGLVLTIIASDAQGNETTATYTLTITDAPAVDTGSPVVSNVTPAAGSAITATTALGIDVTDDSGLFRRIIVYATFSTGRPSEMVYDGDAFLPYYSTSSTVTSIDDGQRFSVTRLGGWPAAPTLKVVAIDRSGNEV